MGISVLIGGWPFYTPRAGKMLAMCEGAYSLGMPLNIHRETFLRSPSVMF